MWKGTEFEILNWDWFLSFQAQELPGIGIGNIRAVRRPGWLGMWDRIRGKMYRLYTRNLSKQPVVPDL